MAPDRVDTWDIFQVIEGFMGKDARDAVVREINKEGFCLELPVFAGAKETVSALKELGVDIIIVTSPWTSKTWVYERTKWLKDHFGFQGSNIIHTSGKWRIKGDLFIDDHPTNVEKWAAHNGYEGAFVWNTPQNRKDEIVMPRLHSWAELLELVEARHGTRR